MKYALIVTGILAGLALAAPGLVVLGFFLLIIPGLALIIAPTLFVYLSLAAVARFFLPFKSLTVSTLTAFGIAMLLGWASMQPFRLMAIREYNNHILPDVVPGHRLALNGHIRLEMPDKRSAPVCDSLCLALLDSPNVNSLTLVTAGKSSKPNVRNSAAFEIVADVPGAPAGIFPHEPGELVKKMPRRENTPHRHLRDAVRNIEAAWALRLTDNERLRETKKVSRSEADWTIRITERRVQRTQKTLRIEILTSDGTVQFRKSYVKQAVPAHIFYLGFYLNLSPGSINHSSFHLGRQNLEHGDKSLQPESELLSAIEFQHPRYSEDYVAKLHDKVVQVLSDPTPTNAQLDLVKRYLGLFYFDASEQDYPLIAQVVADSRFQDVDKAIKDIFSTKKTPIAMRDAYAARILMEGTSKDFRHFLAESLANMPRATFQIPSDDHVAIWSSPDVYCHAAPFLESLADLGPKQAMPMLEAALDHAVTMENRLQRKWITRAICAAMTRLGPDANEAEPKVRELFLRRPSPILTNSKDADQWRFALARMGVAIEDLPFFPSQSEASIRKNQQRVSNSLHATKPPVW